MTDKDRYIIGGMWTLVMRAAICNLYQHTDKHGVMAKRIVEDYNAFRVTLNRIWNEHNEATP